jgi:hypothetical protein
VFGDNTWKLWVTVAVFILATGFATHQYQSTFGSRPPDWMQVREHESQPIEGVFHPDPAWHQFKDLVRTVSAAAELQCAGECTVQFIELASGRNGTVVWSGETVHNQGFDPLPKIERRLGTDPSHLLGYYTSEGSPLAFATSKYPHNDQQVLVTIHLDKPLAPAAGRFLISRENGAVFMGPDSGGERTIGLGYLRRVPEMVEACGVLLPPHATLLRYFPEATATVVSGPETMVAWISTDLKDNITLPSITYSSH